MGYRMSRGFGDYPAGTVLPNNPGCAPPSVAVSSYYPGGTPGAYTCACPKGMYTVNDPGAGRFCVTSCPLGTIPNPNGPYDAGGYQMYTCQANPALGPAGTQLNLQTGAIAAPGTPGVPPAATSSPVPPASPNTLISSGVPPAANSGGFQMPSWLTNLLPSQGSASAGTSGFSFSSILTWAGIAAGIGAVVWLSQK